MYSDGDVTVRLSMVPTAHPSFGSIETRKALGVLISPGSLEANPVSKSNWGKSFLKRVMTQAGTSVFLKG